jgi:hypothetical protein
MEEVDPPLKPTRTATRPPRAVFEGDAAAVELRSRLARTRDGVPTLHDGFAPARGVSVFGTVLRFAGVILTAAAVAGAAGYLASSVQFPSKPARVAAVPSSEAPRTPRPRASAPGPASEVPAAQVAAIGVGGAAQQPGPAVAPAAPPPSFPPLDASEIAARLKLGADLMAAGDITAARTMFMRVVEAGDAAGAFALAETYDPAVLGAMRLRGGITPDSEQARRWYERAREMGSDAAPGRITRLTGR